MEIADYATIYENCILGKDIRIGEHSVIRRTLKPTSAVFRSFDDTQQAIIGDGVSFCLNVIIHTGVSIKENTLVGDNS